MKNVLVFPCDTDEALEINRALGPMRQFQLFGAGAQSDDRGALVYANYIGELDDTLPLFIRDLERVVDEYQIDFIFPASQAAMRTLSRYEAIHSAVVAAPDYRACLIADNPDDLFREIDSMSLEENEAAAVPTSAFKYRIHCFTDHARVLKYVGILDYSNESEIALVIPDVVQRSLGNYAKAINERLHTRGAWSFAVGLNSERIWHLDDLRFGISPEMAVHRNKNVNLAALSLFDRMGHAIEVKESPIVLSLKSDFAANRYRCHYEYDVVYVDLDDTIIIHNQINPMMIAFLYQCRNQGKKIHLITKHAYQLDETLEKFRLTAIFDSVIWLERADEKYKHMAPHKAIFIDDAYLERKQVAERLGIPALDVTAVEGLLDWRL
ncbi:hypothetical protein [Paenibacillus sp. OV219]|uniref:hypothetical protein n=1 Tax=Paenibacillus sp. OV219 TaxID=1884377 RepID=UPI0008AE2C74|nr:hypothetical protein [Paenibacillus sp. OV219]SEN65464.1 hypothetical protein SAMN05518847_103413 [Paenibacillus sp. OV219]